MPRIEIVHYRDSDSSCDLRVFIDGVETHDYTCHDFDPGAGHECLSFVGEWVEAEIAGCSDAVRPLVIEGYQSALENRYTFHDYEYIRPQPDPDKPQRRCTVCGLED